MNDPIQIGLLGFGNVGAGAYRTLVENAENIARQVGVPLNVRRIAVAHPDKPRDIVPPRGVLTGDPYEVLNDPEIHIVCELIGGVQPAYTYIRQALTQGKHVVTANKELLAKHGADLMCEAHERRLELRFEAAVGGGIPIIGPLMTSLAGNHISRIEGIVNGTTNYILTRMAAERRDFAEVLADAQRLGIAEADPRSDVDGWDAAYKMVILANVGMHVSVPVDAVSPVGISRITERDLDFARELGYTIKLLGIAKRSKDRVEVRVHPAMLPAGHPLTTVDDVFNAVLVSGSSVGDVMFYGRGAGAMPTGSSVVGDVVGVALALRAGTIAHGPRVFYDPVPLAPLEDAISRFYIRLHVADRPRSLSAVAGALGDEGISIARVAQHEMADGLGEIVVVTHPTNERAVRAAVCVIERQDAESRAINIIRVEG